MPGGVRMAQLPAAGRSSMRGYSLATWQRTHCPVIAGRSPLAGVRSFTAASKARHQDSAGDSALVRTKGRR
jgi:hypothetical protein